MNRAQFESLIFHRVKAISTEFIGEPINDKTKWLMTHAISNDPLLSQLTIKLQPIIKPVSSYTDETL